MYPSAKSLGIFFIQTSFIVWSMMLLILLLFIDISSSLYINRAYSSHCTKFYHKIHKNKTKKCKFLKISLNSYTHPHWCQTAYGLSPILPDWKKHPFTQIHSAFTVPSPSTPLIFRLISRGVFPTMQEQVSPCSPNFTIVAFAHRHNLLGITFPQALVWCPADTYFRTWKELSHEKKI